MFFCLQALAPISAGVVYVAELFSDAALDYFDLTVHTFKASIASVSWVAALSAIALWLLLLDPHLLVLFMEYFFAFIMLSLLHLRNRWATLVAFFITFRHPVFFMLEILDDGIPCEREDGFICRKIVNCAGSGGYLLVLLGSAY